MRVTEQGLGTGEFDDATTPVRPNPVEGERRVLRATLLLKRRDMAPNPPLMLRLGAPRLPSRGSMPPRQLRPRCHLQERRWG